MNRSSFRKWLLICLAVFALAVFQTGANDMLRVKSIAPDLLFAFAVFFACVEKNWQSVLSCALICGVVSDFVCHSEFIGYTAVYSYSALITYFLKNLFLRPNIFFVNILTIIISILGKTALYPVFYITKGVAFSDFFLNDALPTSVYNTVCFFVIYAIWNFASKRRKRYHAS